MTLANFIKIFNLINEHDFFIIKGLNFKDVKGEDKAGYNLITNEFYTNKSRLRKYYDLHSIIVTDITTKGLCEPTLIINCKSISLNKI